MTTELEEKKQDVREKAADIYMQGYADGMNTILQNMHKIMQSYLITKDNPTSEKILEMAKARYLESVKKPAESA